MIAIFRGKRKTLETSFVILHGRRTTSNEWWDVVFENPILSALRAVVTIYRKVTAVSEECGTLNLDNKCLYRKGTLFLHRP